ncbi:hypothetical protein [Streptomyces sp. NBC_00019]|uniref:hypothetical protein n=1 Tax=Streptomyces sp. NBC_00019 TaxID=2975623 RepID=UPI003251B212
MVLAHRLPSRRAAVDDEFDLVGVAVDLDGDRLVTRSEALIAFIMSPVSAISVLMPLSASSPVLSCDCPRSLPSSDMTASMPFTALVT